MAKAISALFPRTLRCILPQLKASRGKCLALTALAATSMMVAAQADLVEMEGASITLAQFSVEDGVTAPVSPVLIDTITLSISPGGILNLAQYALIVRSSPFNSIYGYVVTGYNGGTWTGFGINSSTAASDPTHLTALGIIDNSEAHYTTFRGRSLAPAAETLVAYTYYGDANLDGDVNQADFALIGTGFGWYHGDFNYSGTVDGADYDLFNTSLQALHPGQVPEPGALGMLAAGAVTLLRRRTRRLAA